MNKAGAVEIRHAHQYPSELLFIDWTLGNACNYRCSYCSPSLHDGSHKWVVPGTIAVVLEHLLEHAKRSSRHLFVQFTGGEVTAIPFFLDTLKMVARMGIDVLIISNGSRDVEWWQKAAQHLKEVVLSYHPETAQYDSFSQVVRCVAATTRTHVNVAAPPSHFNLCCEVAERLANEIENITITLKPMLLGFGSALYPYTYEQLDVLKNKKYVANLTSRDVSARSSMEVLREDGSKEIVSASQFLAEGSNKWRGWSCNAGVEMLCIKANGDIFRGECMVGGKLGNIQSLSTVLLPEETVLCTRNECTCLLDIMTSRSVGSHGLQIVTAKKL